MSKPDARRDYNPSREYVTELIDKAQAAVGSRNALAALVGISRRRLGYIESGTRLLPCGKVLPVTITFAEQVTLEHIIHGGQE